jgi:riboflavin synthase
VSLTVNSIDTNIFDVNIVPHTLTATTLGLLNTGSQVNLEVDLIARHLEQLLNNNKS